MKRKYTTVKGHKVAVIYLGERGLDLNLGDEHAARAEKIFGALNIPRDMKAIGTLSKGGKSPMAVIEHFTTETELGGMLLGVDGDFFGCLSIS